MSINLPNFEDIYDLDTQQLQNVVQEIETHLQANTQQPDKNLNKKAQKILDLCQEELKERKNVENIGNFIDNVQDIDQYFLQNYQQQQLQQQQQQKAPELDVQAWENLQKEFQQEETQQREEEEEKQQEINEKTELQYKNFNQNPEQNNSNQYNYFSPEFNKPTPNKKQFKQKKDQLYVNEIYKPNQNQPTEEFFFQQKNQKKQLQQQKPQSQIFKPDQDKSCFLPPINPSQNQKKNDFLDKMNMKSYNNDNRKKQQQSKSTITSYSDHQNNNKVSTAASNSNYAPSYYDDQTTEREEYEDTIIKSKENIELFGQKKFISSPNQNRKSQNNQDSFSSNNQSFASKYSSIQQKKPKKKDLMSEFIKNTLQKTRIDSNINVGKAQYSKYVPKQQSPDLPQQKSRFVLLQNDTQQYKKVESKLKQDLQQRKAQKQQKLQSQGYYSSGKPTFSNKYQPPPPKDPAAGKDAKNQKRKTVDLSNQQKPQNNIKQNQNQSQKTPLNNQKQKQEKSVLLSSNKKLNYTDTNVKQKMQNNTQKPQKAQQSQQQTQQKQQQQQSHRNLQKSQSTLIQAQEKIPVQQQNKKKVNSLKDTTQNTNQNQEIIIEQTNLSDSCIDQSHTQQQQQQPLSTKKKHSKQQNEQQENEKSQAKITKTQPNQQISNEFLDSNINLEHNQQNINNNNNNLISQNQNTQQENQTENNSNQRYQYQQQEHLQDQKETINQNDLNNQNTDILNQENSQQQQQQLQQQKQETIPEKQPPQSQLIVNNKQISPQKSEQTNLKTQQSPQKQIPQQESPQKNNQTENQTQIDQNIENNEESEYQNYNPPQQQKQENIQEIQYQNTQQSQQDNEQIQYQKEFESQENEQQPQLNQQQITIQPQIQQQQQNQKDIDSFQLPKINNKLTQKLQKIEQKQQDQDQETEQSEHIQELQKLQQESEKRVQSLLNDLHQDTLKQLENPQTRPPKKQQKEKENNPFPLEPEEMIHPTDSPDTKQKKQKLFNMLNQIKDPLIQQQMKQKLKQLSQKSQNIPEPAEEKPEEKQPEIIEKKEEEPQKKRQSSQTNRKKPQKPQISFQNQQLKKIQETLEKENLSTDYTCYFTDFRDIFSYFQNQHFSTKYASIQGNQQQQNQEFLEILRELVQLYTYYNTKLNDPDVKAMQNLLITPFDVQSSESYYTNDPNQVRVYANRVDINIKRFIDRQVHFSKKMQPKSLEKPSENTQNQNLQFRVVKNKSETYDIITRSFMRKSDWEQLPTGKGLRFTWNLMWTWSKPTIEMHKLLIFQKLNHFPGNRSLVRKDLINSNIQKFRKLSPQASKYFDIMPQTFVLPKEYINFSDQFQKDKQIEGQYNYWIIKPIGKSQGKGISVINEISQVVYADSMIVQKYLKNPLLIDGRKFDMRIYVLVTQYNPLEVFIFKEGFARLSTEEFNIHPEDIANTQIHLTNFSIQKNYYDPSSMKNFIGGTKISLKMLKQKFPDQWEMVWQQCKELIVKSLVCVQSEIPHNPNCFEIYGYDIIIDQQYNCKILEVNSSPSLGREFILDDLIKQHMIDDSMDLLGFMNYDKQRLVEVMQRRLKDEEDGIHQFDNKDLLNKDLNYILRGQKFRGYGELPEKMGDFQQIAPGPILDKALKMSKQNNKFSKQENKPQQQ